jgi:hypothetical protein
MTSTMCAVGVLAQDYSYEGGGGGGFIALIFGLFWLAVMVFMIAAVWKVFAKAGEPGWAAIIPIYNAIVLLKIVDKPLWWIVLFLIPLVNLIVGIIVVVALAQKFGKGIGFAVGLILLPIIFYPILGFGSARYQG